MAKLGRPPVEKVTVTCTCCGKSVAKYASVVKLNTSGRFFCSKACQYKVGSKPRTRPDHVCERCGERFRPISNSPGRFCSKACYDEDQRSQRVTVVCQVCGKAVEMKPSQSNARTGRYCSRTCMGIGNIKRSIGREHNGKPVLLNNRGYLYVWQPDHPNAHPNGWILEHRLVASIALGRPLERGEEVNHINRVKTDNRPENLEALSGPAHSLVTQAQMRADREELAEYRRRYGPLPDGWRGRLIT